MRTLKEHLEDLLFYVVLIIQIPLLLVLNSLRFLFNSFILLVLTLIYFRTQIFIAIVVYFLLETLSK